MLLDHLLLVRTVASTIAQDERMLDVGVVALRCRQLGPNGPRLGSGYALTMAVRDRQLEGIPRPTLLRRQPCCGRRSCTTACGFSPFEGYTRGAVRCRRIVLDCTVEGVAMMFGDGGMGVWGFAFMTASTVLFWVVIILGIIALVRYLSRTAEHGGGTQDSTSSAQRLLADRFARGEIDEEEYQRRLQVLGERARHR